MSSQEQIYALETETEVERLIQYWHSLDNSADYAIAVSQAQDLRSQILDSSFISIRKTSGLNDEGCRVNCDYCTLGTQYGHTSNQNKIAPWARERAQAYLSTAPDANIELVGYWPGISSSSTEFNKLVSIISELHQEFPRAVIGGDLGIIGSGSDLQTLHEAGLAYLHNNLETTARLYSDKMGLSVTRLESKIDTLHKAHSIGLPTSSGVLIGLGEEPGDLVELALTLRDLGVERVAVNFMDYGDDRIAKRYEDAKDSLTSEYATKVLVFLRKVLNPHQSLILGSGVKHYFYQDESASELDQALGIVDGVHVGSFINLEESPRYSSHDNKSIVDLTGKLNELGYRVAASSIFGEHLN